MPTLPSHFIVDNFHTTSDLSPDNVTPITMAVKSMPTSRTASTVYVDGPYAGDPTLNKSFTSLLNLAGNSIESAERMMDMGASAGNGSVRKQLDNAEHAFKLLRSTSDESQFDLKNCLLMACDDCHSARTRSWDSRLWVPSMDNDNDYVEVDVEEEPVTKPSKKSKKNKKDKSRNNSSVPSVSFAPTDQFWESEYPPALPVQSDFYPVEDFSARSGLYTRVEPVDNFPRSVNDYGVSVNQTQPSVHFTDDYGVPITPAPRPARSTASDVNRPSARQSQPTRSYDTEETFQFVGRDYIKVPEPSHEWLPKSVAQPNRSYVGSTYHGDGGVTANAYSDLDGRSGQTHVPDLFENLHAPVRYDGSWVKYNAKPVRAWA